MLAECLQMIQPRHHLFRLCAAGIRDHSMERGRRLTLMKCRRLCIDGVARSIHRLQLPTPQEDHAVS